MATWKKVLREDYAVGSNDGLIILDNVVATGASGSATIRLYDSRDDIGNLTPGEGLEQIFISAGDGLSMSTDGTGAAILDLTNTGFTVTAGSTSEVIDLGGTLTFAAGGDLSVAQSGGTVTYSVTIPSAANSFGSITAGEVTTTADSAGDGVLFDDDNVINVSASSANPNTVTFSHATFGLTANTSTAGVDAGSPSFAAITAIGLNSTGHVTSTTTTTFTVSDFTPDVTTDLSGSTTYYLLLQNGGSASNGGTAAFSPYVDTGAAGNVGPQYTPSTGTLRVPNLVVDGTSTQLNVEQVTADDPLIVINNDGGALASNQGGIELNTGSGNAAHIVWNSANANLTGWQVSDSGATQDLHSVAVMDHGTSTPSGGGAGSGSFFFDTTNKVLYVDVA